MASGTHGRAIQWIMLCVLFLGLVGMHHIATNDDMAPARGSVSASAHDAPSSDRPAPQPAHEMSHMCVAVLCAVVSLLLLVGLLLLRTDRQIAERVPASAWPRAPDRPPPRGGRDLLGSLCVLRL
ncbi:hypothetical protein ACSHWB_44815 [Lentzea sp. HUAS TT2]|uniref:hypothetical protein n=1 Tax=Lentzea sp. HUAS TT2 TaxID=3447454 RepID=UPI003F6F0887